MMWPKMIKNEEEYDRALDEIGELMGAEPGSEESERLELLSMIVGAYEAVNHPIAPPTPIEAIRFALESQNMRPADAVKFFGNKTAMSLVMSGKRPLTLGMVRALHKGLGIPADTLIGESGAQLPRQAEGVDFTCFPLAAMAKRGWIAAVSGLKARAEEIVQDFAGAAGEPVFGHAGCFRQGARQNARDDKYAVEAWRLGARIEAAKVELTGRYEQRQMTPEFLHSVGQRSAQGDSAPLQVGQYLAAYGVRLIHVPHLPRTYLDGGVFFMPDGPVIALTLRYDRIDYFWFTLLHDLAHLVRGDVQPGQGPENCLIEDLDMAPSDDRERAADQMATDAMILPHLWEASPVATKKRPTPLDVVNLATQAGVHPAIVAGRWRHEKGNYRLFSGLLGQGEVRKLF